MEIITKIKRNRFVRGFFSSYRRAFGYSPRSFGFYGEKVILEGINTIGNPHNVYLMGDNSIRRATLLTTNAKFIMKPHSAAAAGFTVVTGNHARVVGRFYRSLTEKDKPAGMDKDVVVESDVWIGINVTLLSGVTVGRGATIAAGSVVNKSLPPYCVAGGVPAKPIKFYWTIDQIMEHEAQIYPENERYSREELESIFDQYRKK